MVALTGHKCLLVKNGALRFHASGNPSLLPFLSKVPLYNDTSNQNLEIYLGTLRSILTEFIHLLILSSLGFGYHLWNKTSFS